LKVIFSEWNKFWQSLFENKRMVNFPLKKLGQKISNLKVLNWYNKWPLNIFQINVLICNIFPFFLLRIQFWITMKLAFGVVGLFAFYMYSFAKCLIEGLTCPVLLHQVTLVLTSLLFLLNVIYLHKRDELNWWFLFTYFFTYCPF
jgi:hypothetical protein